MPREYPYDGPTVDLSNVYRNFQHGHQPDGVDQKAIVSGPNAGVPYRNVFNRSFSGADYHITAVIPHENDYEAAAKAEVVKLRAEIYKIEATLPNPPSQAGPAVIGHLQNLRNAERAASAQANTSSVFFKTFAELQTLSITSRRSVHPVRRLGEKDPTYHTRGPRTWAGSMMFVQLDGEVLMDLYRRTHHDISSNEPFFAPDRIPPFNILIQGFNEYGHIVEGVLHGVTIVATGQVLSIDDLYTEEQITYTAVHYTPLSRGVVKRGIKARLKDKNPGRGFGSASEIERVVAENNKRNGSSGDQFVIPRHRPEELRNQTN